MDHQTRDSGALLREQIRLLREHWYVIVLSVVATAAAAYAFSATRPEVYEATSRLLIQRQDLATALTGLQTYEPPDPEREAATALALAQQPVVAAAVVRQLNLDMTPEQLLSEVTIAAEGNSQLMAISARDESPEQASRLANNYAAQYIVFRRDTALAQIRSALEGVREQLQLASAGNDDQREQELRDRMNQLETLEQLEAGGAQLVQQARGATQVAPNPERNAAIGAFLGLLLGVALTLLRDRLDPRLKREEQVTAMLPGVPVMAAIPSWRRDSTPELQSEGFRALQTTMSYLDPDDSVRSLLVTSATVGEGKTTTSLNLALAIAERDESVLVLEGDLRRRGLTTRLKLLEQPGVSEILLGEGEVDDYAVEVSLDELPKRRSTLGRGSTILRAPTLTGALSVVPAGRRIENPHRLLMSERVRRLLSQATSVADKVVVDGTPLGLINDMLPIAARADAVVIVVHLYHTRRNELKRLADQLNHARINPFGLVIFGIDTDRGYDAYMRG